MKLLLIALLLSVTGNTQDGERKPPSQYCYVSGVGDPAGPTIGYYLWVASVTAYYSGQGMNANIYQIPGGNQFEVCHSYSVLAND